MNIKTKTLIILFTAILLFGAQKDVAFAGFGVSPSFLQNPNLVPGSYFEQDIYLVQSTPDVALNTVVTIDAGKATKWIKIEGGNTFKIPKGTQQYLMKVSVSVPSDADLGEYKGIITASTTPDGPQKSGVSVVLGANVAVDLNVTSLRVSDFLIQNYRIPDAGKGSPIQFIMKVKNEGNVDNGPTKAVLTFFDQYHSKQLGQQEKNITDKVKSFQTKDLTVNFENTLDVGSYWADVKIYSDDKTVIDSKIVFNVVVGVPQKQLFALPNFSAIPWWAYIIALAVIVILALVVAVVVLLWKKATPKIRKK